MSNELRIAQRGPTARTDGRRCRSSTSTGRGSSARAGGRREIRCPADGTLVAEVDEAGRGRHRGRDRRGAPTPSTTGPGRRTSARERGDLLLRVADLLERDKAADRPRRVARHRQAPGRERVRRRRRGRGLPPLRPRRRRGRRPGRRHRQRRRGQPDRARAGRRLRADHAVELPAAPDLLEGRALPGRRQHLRAQAERADPAHRDPPDAAARGGRAAGRRRQPRARRRPARRRPARRGPPRRPGLVHRRPGRPASG